MAKKNLPAAPTKPKMGRPPKPIDKKIFENLCQILATEAEMCAIFECSEDTLNRWCKREYNQTFEDIYKSKSSEGKASLRRAQFASAMAGNATLQIWLGKQHLGQSDKVEHSGNESQPLVLNYKVNG